MTRLVALTTLAQLSRRKGALTLLALLPLAFFLVRLDTHWTALRLLSMGLGWAVATLSLFTFVSARSLDRRLVVSGASPSALHFGRLLAMLILGLAISAVYVGLVSVTIRQELHNFGSVALMLALTVLVSVPLGALVAAFVPRDLEGALLLLAIMAVQVLVDPAPSWTKALPLWSTRELATYVVEPVGVGYLHRALIHASVTAFVLLILGLALGASRLRLRHVDPIKDSQDSHGATY